MAMPGSPSNRSVPRDQYVRDLFAQNKAPVLKPARVRWKSLNIEKTVRSATSLSQRIDQTVKIFNAPSHGWIERLSEERDQTGGALDNFRLVS